MAFQFLQNLKEKAESFVTSLDEDKSGNVSFGEVIKGIAKTAPFIQREGEALSQIKAQPEKTAEILQGPTLKSPFGRLAAGVGEVAADIVRAPSRAVASVGIQAAADITTLAVGKKVQAEFKPSTPFQRAILGEEPIVGFGEQAVRTVPKAQKIFQNLGMSEETALGASFAATPLFVGGMIGLDLSPIGGGGKKTVEKVSKSIAKTQNVDEIIRSLDTIMRGKPAAKKELAEILRTVNDPMQVERIVNEAFTTARTGSFSSKAVKEAEESVAAKKISKIEEPIEEIPTIARKSTGETFVPAKEGLEDVLTARAARLQAEDAKRLAKINLKRIEAEEDVVDAIRNTSKLFEKETAARARGVISFSEATDVAKALGMTPDDLLKLPPGALLNVETMKGSRAVLAASAEELVSIAKEFQAAPTSEAASRLLAAQEKHAMIQTRVKAAKSEAARVTGSLREKIGAGIAEEKRTIIREFLERGEREGVSTERLMQKLKAKTPEEAAISLAKTLTSFGDDAIAASEFVANIQKPSFLDKLLEFSVAAKLWTPTTHLVNILGNISAAMFRPTEKFVAGAFDFFQSKITGKERERFLLEGVHDIYGASAAIVQGIPDAIHVLFETLNPGMALGRLESSSGATADLIRALKEEDFLFKRIGKGAEARTIQGGAIGGTTGKIVRTPFRVLQASDAFFHTMNKTASIHSQAYRQALKEKLSGQALKLRVAELIKNPSDEMLESAKEAAKEFTFQSDLGKFTRDFGNLRRKYPLLKFIFPFFNTPVNVAKFSIQRSPAGILSPRNWSDMMKEGGARADAMARISIGSAIASYMALLVGQGHITGAAPEEEKERDKFYRTGKLPYAIKIGDSWVQYQRLEPLATLFSMSANVHDAWGKRGEEPAEELISSLVFETAQHWTDQTFLLGLSDSINAMNDPERYGKRFINSLVTGQIPSIIPFMARSIDRTIRDPEGIVETVISRLPLASRSIRPRVDVFGQEAIRPGGFINELSPVKISKEKIDVVESELEKIDYTISIPSASISREGRSVKLSKDEELEVKQTSGQVIHSILQTIIQSDDWYSLSEENKKKAVQKVVDSTRDLVRDNVFVDAEMSLLKLDMPEDATQQKLLKEIILSKSYNQIEDAAKRKAVLAQLMQ